MLLPSPPLSIVLIEDDLGHSRLIEKNLRRNQVTHPIVKISEGVKAIEYFFGKSAASRSRPVLVILDLNLPGFDGYKVLRKLKSEPTTRAIPILVLTTAEDAQDVKRCYELGCNLYISKPVDYHQFADTIGKISAFLSVIQVPEAV